MRLDSEDGSSSTGRTDLATREVTCSVRRDWLVPARLLLMFTGGSIDST